MLKINREQLVCQSVIGEITSPLGGINPYRVNPEGHPDIYPGVGGITYNLRIGDRACGLFADHVEPGVSISNFTQVQGQPGPNRALNLYSCAGNLATVVSGEAKGEKGRVTGKHGGIEHVLLDFAPEVLEKLVIGDKIQIKAFGCGLQLTDYPGVKVINLDPDLLALLPLKKGKKGKLQVPVTHLVPAAIMGSGLGSPHSHSGDYDIQLFDQPTVKKYKLHDLRLGDFVAIIDADATYGRIYRSGGVVIGIVVHSDCVLAGHGPGVMVVMAAGGGEIEPVIDAQANLTSFLPAL
ncbi:DUF4438 domain-containing protein [Desulfurivibrio alkaliphilus]|uniref:DUF4438 domain-containing protein n=1 Tax=Desulfurivibrio alkaliphilus (strain DSM 19089 / UNIQEM U267 / AHT2) TaxID=589865 RepID=D6Z0J2_DESAT|nr:DUF4438 domain-containing protein [Desulfurivibrio alkaliphilus]ADH85221.1 conserved hypothetical protein [Desulfurivibrio alkaliphilus AHT 2]